MVFLGILRATNRLQPQSNRAIFMDFSVAIRTYNRADQLRLVLDALKQQIKTAAIAWEIVLVDNNSTDHTAQLVQEYQATWPPQIAFRYIFEPRQGAAIARRRAIQESQGTLIGFLDDDNVPSPNWVAAAHTFAQTHPQAAAFGGKNLPVFATPPPIGFQQLHPYFALVDRGDTPRPYDPKIGVLPPGAGLVVRRQTWLDRIPPQFVLQGPTQTGIPTKGEDLEALSHLVKAGEAIWYNPTMTLYHHIPTDRLQPNYLTHFCHTIGRSSHPLRMLRFDTWQRPLMILLYLASDLVKLLRHHWKHRKSWDLIAQCQQAMLLGHLHSPFLHSPFFRSPFLQHRRHLPN
jgi:glycosyltransferase involved in cell wall biosynthesis